MDQHLTDGSRVCIVGGGPAGSFAVLHLLDQAAGQGLRLEVLIFEPRDFTHPGPMGCNRCAGILSSRLLTGLQDLGITFPNELSQADVQSHAVCLQDETVCVERPGPQHRILSVYRGRGPRIQQGASFCRGIVLDNHYGQALFRMWAMTLRTPNLLHAWVHAIRHESNLPPERGIHQRILWGMFMGKESYRTLFWLAVTPRAMAEVARGWRRLQ